MIQLSNNDWDHITKLSGNTTYVSIDTQHQYYIKCNIINSNNNILYDEYRVIQYIDRQQHADHRIGTSFIYDYYEYRTINHIEYLAVQCYPGQQCIVNYAINSGLCNELIDSISQLHSYGILHNDIKPDHIYYINNHIKLIDYNLCTHITHRNIQQCHYYRGTIDYSGIGSHLGYTTSVASDYESLCYIILYLYNTDVLTWINTGNSIYNEIDHIINDSYVHIVGDRKIRFLYTKHTDNKLQYIINQYIIPLIVSQYTQYNSIELYQQYCTTLMKQFVVCLCDRNMQTYDNKPFITHNSIKYQFHYLSIDTVDTLQQWLYNNTITTDTEVSISYKLHVTDIPYGCIPFNIDAYQSDQAPDISLFQHIDLSHCTRDTICNELNKSIQQLELLLQKSIMFDHQNIHPYYIIQYHINCVLFIECNTLCTIDDIMQQYCSSHYNLLYPYVRILCAIGCVYLCDISIKSESNKNNNHQSALDMLLSAAFTK